MNKITSFGLLFVAATLLIGGTNSVLAQDDPAILHKIAINAQDQIRNNISDNSPDEVKNLFQEGSIHVYALSNAIASNDTDSAKKHFLASMGIFKEISHKLHQNDSTKSKIDAPSTQENDIISKLQKLERYTSNLKSIAQKYDASISSTTIDNLFATAKEQINSEQFSNAQDTIREIRQVVGDIKTQLQEHALKQEPERAKKYAQKYLELLDRLIESAKNQGISDDIINRLESSKETLSSATEPEDIIKECRKIISIKNQFELTKNDTLEQRIMHVEKILLKLSHINQVNPVVDDAKENLQQIKYLLSENEIEHATILLRDLSNQLSEILKSLQ